MRKLLRLFALVLVTPACSAFGTAPAATVRGTEITVASVEDELEAINANDAYRQALEQSYGAPTAGTSERTFNAAFAAQILSLRVYYELLEQDLDRRGVAVTEETLASTEEEMRRQFSGLGEDVFDSFPDEYRMRLIEQRALLNTVQLDVEEAIGDDPRAFYETHEEDFAEICLSHVLVGLQGGRTPEEAEEEAAALHERIEDGEDFEEIASEESDDTAAAAQAGSLGCGSKLSLQFDPVFERAAFALEEGEVSEPVLTQFGAHLILVTDRTIPRYAEIEASIPSVMQQARDTAINEYLVDVICGTEVEVNPRFGTWTADRCEGLAPQLPMVEPPEGPVAPAGEGPELGF
jgi:peptidyl-prolyl cis-trans isomerase D